MRKGTCLICLLLLAGLLTGLLGGCAGRSPEPETESVPEGMYRVYYVRTDTPSLQAELYRPQAAAEDVTALAEELIDRLKEQPLSEQLASPVTEEIVVRGLNVENGIVTVLLGGSYNTLETVTELLFRAASVRTLCQIPDVSGVQFLLNGQPLTDARGNVIGVLTADSFAESHADRVTRERVASLVLYFADETGEYLVPVEQRVRYSGDFSLERAVMTQLLRGPSRADLQAPLPAGTELIGITTRDGVCYVDVSDAFTDDTLLADHVTIYSIVDSLTELGNVSKVQISVGGSTDINIGNQYPLSTLYERNLEFVKGE